MLTETRRIEPSKTTSPGWETELRNHARTRDATAFQMFRALVSQTRAEIDALTRYTASDGNHRLVQQQAQLVHKCLSRLEQHLIDTPTLKDGIADLIVLAALEKRRKRKEELARPPSAEEVKRDAQCARLTALVGRADHELSLVAAHGMKSRGRDAWAEARTDRNRVAGVAGGSPRIGKPHHACDGSRLDHPRQGTHEADLSTNYRTKLRTFNDKSDSKRVEHCA